MIAINVLEGRLEDPYTILAQGSRVKVSEWKSKAAWQFLRLSLGYERADSLIKEYAEREGISKRERRLRNVPLEVIQKYNVRNERELQFILEGNCVVAVATLQHLLVPPSKVYAVADRMLKTQAIETFSFPLEGKTYILQEEYGYQRGIQVVAGDLITQRAIKVSGSLKILSCLNPISWIGIGVFERFMGYVSGWERIVRIKRLTDLEPRLKNAISSTVRKLPSLSFNIERAKKCKVPLCDAEMFTVAFGYSYSLGAKVLKQVLERFESEDKSLYGLAQAFSWVAAHGEKIRKTPEGMESHARQKLSTIAGAFLTLDPNAYEDAKDRTIEWLKRHIREGKLETYEELLQHAKEIK